jgi:hypothetical protein
VIVYDNAGRPYLNANSPLAWNALLNIARGFVGRKLHYAVFRQDAADSGAVFTKMRDFNAPLHKRLLENAKSMTPVNQTHKYELLCSAPLRDARDDRDRHMKIDMLKVLGLVVDDDDDVDDDNDDNDDDDDDDDDNDDNDDDNDDNDDNDEQEEDEEEDAEHVERDLPSCVPALDRVPSSPTLMFSLLDSGDAAALMERLHMFLMHQSDDVNVLCGGVQATYERISRGEREIQLHHVSDKLQSGTRSLSAVTQVLLTVAILRVFGIDAVHQHRRVGKSGRFAHDWTPSSFDAEREVCDPWSPHQTMSADEFGDALLRRVAELKRDYRMCRGVRKPASPADSSDIKRKSLCAIGRSIVNEVLGCNVIANDGAVRSVYLHYKAALLPYWARARRAELSDDVYAWLDSIGDVWARVFEQEEQVRGVKKPIRPFTHPAHARSVQTSLAKFQVRVESAASAGAREGAGAQTGARARPAPQSPRRNPKRARVQQQQENDMLVDEEEAQQVDVDEEEEEEEEEGEVGEEEEEEVFDFADDDDGVDEEEEFEDEDDDDDEEDDFEVHSEEEEETDADDNGYVPIDEDD